MGNNRFLTNEASSDADSEDHAYFNPVVNLQGNRQEDGEAIQQREACAVPLAMSDVSFRVQRV